MVRKIRLRVILVAIFLLSFSGAVLAQEAAPALQTIKGGSSYADAMVPPKGQDLKLSDHLKHGDYRYFAQDITGGQTLTVSLSVGEKGIEFGDKGPVETETPYAALYLYDVEGNLLGQIIFDGEKNLKKMLQIDATSPQKIYVVVGSSTKDMNKDWVSLKFDLTTHLDADGQGEAGATIETSLPIEQGRRYEENSLSRIDEVDFFQIATTTGETVSVQMTPRESKAILNAALYDELKHELTRGRSESPGSAMTLTTTAVSSKTYLKVSRELDGESVSYSLALLPLKPTQETKPTAAAETVGTPPTPATQPGTPVTPAPSKPEPATLPPPVTSAPATEEKAPLSDDQSDVREKILKSQIERQKQEIENLKKQVQQARTAKVEKPQSTKFDWKKLKWTDFRLLTFLMVVLGFGVVIGLVLSAMIRRKRSSSSGALFDMDKTPHS